MREAYNMAAKKKKGGKKVMVSIDAAALEALLAAAEALSRAALGIVVHCDDPATKKKLTKRAKRR
jgi:hypothetical protein